MGLNAELDFIRRSLYCPSEVLAREIRHSRQIRTQIKEDPFLRDVSAARFHNYIILRIHEAANQRHFFSRLNSFYVYICIICNIVDSGMVEWLTRLIAALSIPGSNRHSRHFFLFHCNKFGDNKTN